MSVTIKGFDRVYSKLTKVKQGIAHLPEEAYKEFIKNTPIKKGNARRNTKLRNKKTIAANYPYAGRLNEGYSKQAPQGMVEPTLEFMRERVSKIVRGS